MKFFSKVMVGGAILSALMLGSINGTVASAQTVTALPSVDLNRFAGTWYEIARLPTKREKACIADVVDLIALAYKPDRLTLVNSCKTKSYYTDVTNATIKAEKNSGDAKLKVTYLWPFSEKEWILALGADYEWVLIGSPNHKMLRLLSRSRSLSPEVLSEVKLKATSEGYATDKLLMTLQRER